MNGKWQIMVLAVSKNGHYLPPQLIYTGKTNRCLPKVSFPTGWHITCTENHWANEVTTLQYTDKILLSYVTKTRKEQNLSSNQCCIVIFDNLKLGILIFTLIHFIISHTLTHPITSIDICS